MQETQVNTVLIININININNVINLSVTFTAIPFDDCPTVAAACSRHRQCVTSAAATVGQSQCVCVCAITDDYDKGGQFPIASPKYVPFNYCQFINDYPCFYNN